MVKRHFVCALEGCNNEFDRYINSKRENKKQYCCIEHSNLAQRKTNEYIFYQDYAEIVVDSKKYGVIKTKIDLEDVDKCKKYYWYLHFCPHTKSFYFQARDRDKKFKVIHLHRYLMDCPDNMVIDHINTYDHNDNRKSNLRIVTVKENNQNQKLYCNNKSGIKGVSWHKIRQKWQVNVGNIYGGLYDTIEEAKKVAENMRRKRSMG